LKLILFNTCGAEASVALTDTDRAQPLVVQAKMPGRTASESLVAELRRALVDARWAVSDLDGIVVVTGPGSFTGVRVGLSAAKGLAEAIGKPMIGVSRLAMLATAVGSESKRVCALLDAGRGEFFCGEYSETGARESLMSKEDILRAAALADTVVVCEQGVLDSVREALDGSISVTMVAEPGASVALPLAMKKIAAGAYDDPVTLDANYLRRTDAEIFSSPAKRAG
jgi:tRNA threonylcarbamoyladenosine biosynthesis protein TsaB